MYGFKQKFTFLLKINNFFVLFIRSNFEINLL